MNIYLYTFAVIFLSVFLSTVINCLIMKEVVAVAAKVIEKMHYKMLGLIDKIIEPKE